METSPTSAFSSKGMLSLAITLLVLLIASATTIYMLAQDKAQVVAEKEAQIKKLQEENLSFSTQLDQARSEIENCKAQVNENKTRLDEISKRAKNCTSELSSTKSDLAALKKSQLCEDAGYFETNYSSNAAVSESLKKYVGEVAGGDITKATWDVLWSNSRAAKHWIIVRETDELVGYGFIVYFDEVGFSQKRVFQLNNQCWLDRE